MNNKGFTLVELLAVIVLLAIISGIAFGLLGGSFSNAKNKTEDVFIGTIRDAMDMYISSDATSLGGFAAVLDDDGKQCYLKKRNGYDENNNLQYKYVVVYGVEVDMQDVITSSFHPLTQDDLVNPANEEVACADAGDIDISIYKDEDYVYYYSINKSEFGCLNDADDTVISNLPGEFICQ